MSTPEISVVMGVYNGMPHLEQAVASILSQEDVDLELIVVDDGSTDATPDFLAEKSAEDPRLRVINQSNSGLTRALIRGCREARGRYIARQDSDDYSLPGRLASQKRILDTRSDVVFVSCFTNIVGPCGEFLYQSTRPIEASAATSLLRSQRGGPVHGSVMMRREAYLESGGYRQEFYFSQDNDLWLRLSDLGDIMYASLPLYCLRIHPSSISGALHFLKVPFANAVADAYQVRKLGCSDAFVLERLGALPVNGSQSVVNNSSRRRTSYFIGNLLLKNRDYRTLGYLLASVSLFPLYLRALPKLPLAWFMLLKKAFSG